MLVLTRKVGERVYIGNSVVVTVAAIDQGRVRLAFDAPAHVAIQREEVRRRSQAALPAERGRASTSLVSSVFQ